MVPTTRLRHPAWAHHESVLRCLQPGWCLFSVPGQGLQGSALWLRDLGKNVPVQQVCLHPCVPDGLGTMLSLGCTGVAPSH